jgi:hypothetical protein
LQAIQELQARALRRADAVDELDRLLFAARGKRRSDDMRDDSSGLWAALKRLFLPNRAAGKVQKLERQLARAQAALRIAVDELHQAHCQQLRTAPWSGSLLAPTEAGLRDANEDYHPWNRVLKSGRRVLLALHGIDNPELDIIDKAVRVFDVATDGPGFTLTDRINRRIDAANRAGEAIQGFLKALQALKRERSEADLTLDNPALAKIADRLAAVRTLFGLAVAEIHVGRAERTVAALIESVRQRSGSKFDEVEDAQDRLEEVNHQISLAAWSKIPARLRPAGR